MTAPVSTSGTSARARRTSLNSLFWAAVLLTAGVLMAISDARHAGEASRLTLEGSPPPALDPQSPTGYAGGLRYFLGTAERGETYRWIAATQDFLSQGPKRGRAYTLDTAPTGRPDTASTLYTAWLAALSWIIHLFTDTSTALAVEAAALWEPCVVHALAFLALVGFMWRRFGAAAAGCAGLLFVLSPPVAAQFIPGALTPRTLAMVLGSAALAAGLAAHAGGTRAPATLGSAVLAGFALWLDPAFGFPAVLVGAAIFGVADGPSPYLPLRWALIGAAIVCIGWWIDGAPIELAAGELRSVHPLYALAWIGLGGIAVGGRLVWRSGKPRRVAAFWIISGTIMVAALLVLQVREGFSGWLYPGAAASRLSSLDETRVHANFFSWMFAGPPAPSVLIGLPLLALATAAALAIRRLRSAPDGETRADLLAGAITALAVLVLALLRIRWSVPASVLAVPLIWVTAAMAERRIRVFVTALGIGFIAAMTIWGRHLPADLDRARPLSGLGPLDMQALLHRHLALWLAGHAGGKTVTAVAPPDLSDSLVFHGGCRVLMSTAWQSYPGQVVASRLFSALESSEAEAVVQSREITHIIVPSWDVVLPRLVQKPKEAGKDTLYERLDRWVLPRFLRPVPYKMPPVPGYDAEKVAVFRVVDAQDEALQVSRLAEYFVEMGRPEPAGLAAKVLADAFPDDPNAMIARAMVAAQQKKIAAFERELEKLAASATAGQAPFTWDRRVQRAVVLAMGKRTDLARSEIAACMASITPDDLRELTALQAFQFTQLAQRWSVPFPDEELARLARSLCAEYSSPSRPSPGP